MPLIEPSDYAPPWFLRNPHLQTVVPSLWRRVDGVAYRRERLTTPDDDFLDLDWVRTGAHRVAVISHGLEGDTQRGYVRGMARLLARHGWDVLAWNYRGCSGEPNRQLRSYHSGATGDLHLVVQHALGQGYAQGALVGFSLGGNLTLKYVGERGPGLDPRVCAAVAVSVPCDLGAGAAHIDEAPINRLYRRRFLVSLLGKARQKKARFPDALASTDLDALTTLRDFDEHFTAPLHGFRDAADYYQRCSSTQFLPDIGVPTLILTAADDPFLPPPCYPIAEARGHPFVHLEVPSFGGHVGFMTAGGDGAYWSEQRTVAFLEEKVLFG